MEEDFAWWKGTLHRKKSFTKRKRLHKIFLQVYEITKLLHTCSLSFNKFIWENTHLGPWLIFNSKKTFPLTSFESLLNWLNKRNYSFVKNITTKIVLPINFNINFYSYYFSFKFYSFCRTLQNLCPQIYGTPNGISLPLISFTKKNYH